MDPVTLIVTALAAGAASALQDGASSAVKDAYARVKALVMRRFANRPKGELVLAEHEAAPQVWEAPLAAELSAAGAGGDADLVAAAQALMGLVDQAGSRSGKYVVAVRGSQGVQVGDRNTQTNTFGPGPALPRGSVAGMSGGTGAGGPPVARVEIPDGRGVQVGDHGIQDNKYIQTYIEKQVIQPGPVPAGEVRVVAGDIPQEPPGFQPRADLLAELDAPSPRGRVSVVHAVTGMRGVGKTQLAAAYARARLGEGWRLVAWVNSEDTAAVLGGLAEVTAALGLDAGTGDAAAAGRAVRHRLETDGDHCLLVFDNATDPQDLLPFLPAAGRARVLITSNERPVADLGAGVAVDVFTQDEALAFLADRTGSSDTGGARLLAGELGCLPLALAQAAAVIAAQHLDYPAYLQRLRAKPVDQLLLRTGTDRYPHGLAAAVLLSLDAVRAEDGTGGVQRTDGPDVRTIGRRGSPDAAVHRRANRCADRAKADGPSSPGHGRRGAGSAGRIVVAHLQRGRHHRDRAPAGDAGGPGTASTPGPSHGDLPGRRRRARSSGTVTEPGVAGPPCTQGPGRADHGPV